MAETELLFDTRLIGAEDVNWDNSGTNEKTTFTDDNDVSHDSSLINAGHVPLPSTTRALLDNEENVAAGMEVLANRISDISGGSSSSLSEDTTIEIDSTQTASAIQSIIDQQPKNLGGHTLTFLFSAGFDASLSSALVFDGFYNGFLVVDLSEDTVSDAADIGNVFHLHDCFCKVEVKNGSISHTLSYYGIKAERCPCVYLTDLAFTGAGGGDDYAFCGIDSDGVITSCSYQNDKTKSISGVLAGLTEEHNSANGAHSALFSSKAPLVSPAFSGTPTAPTAAAGTNTTQVATTAFVTGALSAKAPLASPAFTGTPTAPTAAANSNSSQIANTEWIRYMFAASSSDGLMPALKDTTGYTKLPNGLILQWGRVSVSSAGTSTITLPLTFPNAILCAFCCICGVPNTISNYSLHAHVGHTNYWTKSTFSVMAESSFMWFAIGD